MRASFFLVLLFLASCSNDEPQIKANELVGEWKWVRTTGGFAGVNQTPAEGEVKMLQFNNDYAYQKTNNGTVVKSGKYLLGTTESMLFNKEMPSLTLDSIETYLYAYDGDVLTLSEDVYDGFSYQYIRK